MLNEEIHRYTELSGNNAEHESIQKIGAYLDGYDKGVADVRENVRGEWIVYPLIDEGRVELECPICGDTFIRAVNYKPQFCENCGSQMMKGEQE